MHLGARDRGHVVGCFTVVRETARADPAAPSKPEVVQPVSEILSNLKQYSGPALRLSADPLDGWTGGDDVGLDEGTFGTSAETLPEDLRPALDVGVERPHRFARMQRSHLHVFEDEVALVGPSVISDETASAGDPDGGCGFLPRQPAPLRLPAPGPVVHRRVRRPGQVRHEARAAGRAWVPLHRRPLVAGYLKQLTDPRATRDWTPAQAARRCDRRLRGQVRPPRQHSAAPSRSAPNVTV